MGILAQYDELEIRLKAVNYFRKNIPSQIFDKVPKYDSVS